jgi:hypothetical protein
MRRLLCVFLLSAACARADEWGKEASDLSAACGDLFASLADIPKCGAFFFNSGKPIRLLIPQSVVPGGGSALGAIFVQPLDIHNWPESNLSVSGGSSLRGFWFGDATMTLSHRKFGGDWNTARDEFQIQAYARARGLPLMPFYGIGPNSSRANLTDFKERDLSAGASVFVPLQSWFAAGGATEFLSPRVGDVHESGVRSIDSLFSDATAPGISSQPNFTHYEVFARPKRKWKWSELNTAVTYDYYQDHGAGHYSFHKFRTDFLQKFYPEFQKEPTGGSKTTFRKQPKYDSVLYIAARFTDEGAGAGRAVPFYLQETLGGSDIDNVPTLRGYQDYRFRAPALFEIQTQYERRLLPSSPPGVKVSTLRSVAGAVGILAFYDAGEVANKASDLSFANMRQSFGFGFTLWSGEKVWFRTYIGLGSGEGSHLFLGVSDPSSAAPHL